MSHKVVTLVYSVKVGSAARKSVLAYMADCASEDGTGVWASKKTIADELECGRSTVIRVCNELVSEGILIVTGERKCTNGATVEYALNLAAIRALEPIKKDRKTSQSGTSPERDRSQSETPPVPEWDPKTSQSGTQTVLEPSLNRDTPCSPPKPPPQSRLPEGWVPDDAMREYALSQKLNDAEIQEIADDFFAYWTDRRDKSARKSERGWRQTWNNRVRDVAWKFIRNRGMAQAPQSARYGQAGGMASAVARRRAGGQN